MNYQPEPSLLNTPLNQMCARILSQSVRANYFYFFSAALMLCASYLLISSQALDGSAFVRTCKAWAILQGYEVLLIATAAWIVRRLKIMDDAFSLLLVELVLLLDPTFFSNSFSTQLNAPGMWVDVLCFAFAGIKCVFLMRLLHLRLLPQMWGALLFAFVAVYLLEVPLNKPYAFKTLEPKEYSFLLVWGPMVYACLCPALGKMFSVTTEDATYLPQDRQTFLNRLLLGLPLLIIVCHDMESLRVHEIIRSTPHLAPLFMAAAVVLLRNTPAAESARRIGWVDVCCVLALVCSYAHPDYEENCPKPFNPEALTGWMKTFPVLLAGACTLGLYAWIYARCRTRQVLYRLGGIGVVLILWLVFRSGAVWAEIKLDYLAIEGMLGAICQSIMGWGIWRGLRIALVGALNVFSWTVSCVLNASGSGIAWLYEHPAIVLWVFAMVLGGLLLRYRKNGILWTTFGWLMLWNLFHLTPANWGGLQWEMVQAVIVYGLVMDHLFQNSARGNRYVFVAIVAGIALLRFIGSPGWGTGCVIALEAVALFLFGIKLRYFGYLVVSVGQIVLAALYGCHLAHFKLDAALSVLIVALAFFGLAVCITFFKKQISAWLEKFFGEMKPLSFAPGLPGANSEVPLSVRLSDSSETKPEEVVHLETEDIGIEPPPDDIAQFFRTLFIADRPNGIATWEEEAKPNVAAQKIIAQLNMSDKETPLVYFYHPDNSKLLLVLSETHLYSLVNPRDERIRYEQIRTIYLSSRELILRGHLEQEIKIPQLTRFQRQCLHKALWIIKTTTWAEFLRDALEKQGVSHG